MLTWMVNRVPSITRPGFATEWHGDTTLDDTHSQSLCCTYHRQPAKHAPVVAPHDIIQFREVVCRQHRLSQIVREWALLRGETLGDRERTWEQRVVPRHTHLAGYLDETRAGASHQQLYVCHARRTIGVCSPNPSAKDCAVRRSIHHTGSNGSDA